MAHQKILRIEEPSRRAAVPGFALWQLGFRPFYLLSSAFAALSIALWALQFSGWLGSHSYLQGPVWHAHEMLFGFTLAVIVGFLFTAGRNWSNRPTPSGPLLAALAALWLAGRVLVLTPWALAAALVNVAFPLAAAVALAVPFIASRNRRNYFFVGLLLLLALAQSGVHLTQMDLLTLPAWAGIQLGLDVVLFILAVMAGRVVPMFTNNGVHGAQATRQPWLEKMALGSVLALLLADALRVDGVSLSLLLGLGACAHLGRWLLWQPSKTLRTPLVWVLHLAYLWIPVHLLLRGLASLGVVAPSLATHALTLGAIGGLVIGMMTRTALGHTGRLLRARRSDVVCYGLIFGAALLRVLVPMMWPGQTVTAVLASALLWSAGFGLYTITYWPILTRARADGRPG